MLERHKETVRATVPVLKQHGEEITQVFYRGLFSAHPQLLNVFNPANQENGGQARSLAASILAYASHIDQLDELSGMVNRITHKHASLEVQPEHYPIVGEHLLAAIRTVLGDAATPEVLEAWGAAYGQLAQIMIDHEQSLYENGATQPGGWSGYKPLKVDRKVRESETITSFYLVAPDAKPLPTFLPGQYLALKIKAHDQAFEQVRQYSLSHVSNSRFYRISVKREPAPPHKTNAPAGQISNYLHSEIEVGDTVLAHVPQGDFVLRPRKRPVVLLSGGVGVTPAVCMLHQLAEEGCPFPVLFVHAAMERAHHAFAREARSLAVRHPEIQLAVYYERVGARDVLGKDYHQTGRISLETLRPLLPNQPADYYYCGPVGFMAAVENVLDALEVPLTDRYSEAFAPDPSFVTELVKK